MKNDEKKGNVIVRFFRMLVEARWFFTFSASVCATVVGISLTFGINSCRETNRIKKEGRKSLVQASENLNERIEEARRWLSVINRENEIYEKADSILTSGAQLPDSVAMEFYNSFPYVRLSSFDHEFEKIFRGSYQLWQVQDINDSLYFYIRECYDGLNIVEETCLSLTEGLLQLLAEINVRNNFYRQAPQKWSNSLVTDPSFQYFMSIRSVKTDVADNILSDVEQDYENHVLPLSNKIREK